MRLRTLDIISATTVHAAKHRTMEYDLIERIGNVDYRMSTLAQAPVPDMYRMTNNGLLWRCNSVSSNPVVTSPEPPFSVGSFLTPWELFGICHVPDFGSITKQGFHPLAFAAERWVLPLSQVSAPRYHWHEGTRRFGHSMKLIRRERVSSIPIQLQKSW